MSPQQATLHILSQLDPHLGVNLSSFENHRSSLVSDQISQLQLSDEVRVRVMAEFEGAGPLSPLIDDSEVSEILVNGLDNIWFEKNGTLNAFTDSFHSPITFDNFLQRLYLETGTEATINQPCIDGTWRKNRFHLVLPPLSPAPTLSIRKPSAAPWTLSRLQEAGWATPAEIDCIKKLVTDRKSFLVVGGTSSGKTSVLAACLLEIPTNERALIIEDTSELPCPNRASTRLLVRQDPRDVLKAIPLQDLVRQALRMRPNRIIMGEVRGPEAKDLLMAFATGHEGSLGTLHAQSAQEALLRLEMLIQLGAPQWSVSALRRLILLAISHIVVVKRSHAGQRSLEGIYRLTSVEDFGFLTEKVTP